MGAAFEWGVGISSGGGPMIRTSHLRVADTTYELRIIHYSQPQPSTESPAVIRDTVEFVNYRTDDGEHEFDHVPYEDDKFAWAAGLFVRIMERTLPIFSVPALFVLVRGEQAPVKSDQLRQIDAATIVGPIWCPVANMKVERPYGPGSTESKRGSKHFKPGAKLYCDTFRWGDGYAQIQVVGHHRGSHRYVTMVVRSSWLTNWRLELAYSPYVIQAFWPRWDGTPEGKERAQEIVDMLREREREAAEQPEASPE